jgi:hypothetical protein
MGVEKDASILAGASQDSSLGLRFTRGRIKNGWADKWADTCGFFGLLANLDLRKLLVCKGSLVRRVGIEPTTEANAGFQKATDYTVNDTQKKDLAEIAAAWHSLIEPLKAAVLAIVRTANALAPSNFPDTVPPVSGETINPAETPGE